MQAALTLRSMDRRGPAAIWRPRDPLAFWDDQSRKKACAERRKPLIPEALLHPIPNHQTKRLLTRIQAPAPVFEKPLTAPQKGGQVNLVHQDGAGHVIPLVVFSHQTIRPVCEIVHPHIQDQWQLDIGWQGERAAVG
jgi:hypothetical protein